MRSPAFFPKTPLIAALAATLALAACGERTTSDSAPAAAAPATSAVEGPPPVMPADAPPQEEAPPTDAELAAGTPATDGSCLSEVGKAAADRLVQRCIRVSPATRPPCNVANPCALIQGEIDRSCGQYGPEEQKPAECEA